MTCPKCNAKIGIMNHQIVHNTGVVYGSRCIMCGFWEFDHPVTRNNKRSDQALRVKR
jgi:hypothetical protein